jgi:hypothetical protein
MSKKNQIKPKTEKEMLKIYNTLNEVGMTPEDVMLYLLVHMEKLRAAEIGMDMTSPQGKKYSIIVSLMPLGIDDRLEAINKMTKNTTPSVI